MRERETIDRNVISKEQAIRFIKNRAAVLFWNHCREKAASEKQNRGRALHQPTFSNVKRPRMLYFYQERFQKEPWLFMNRILLILTSERTFSLFSPFLTKDVPGNAMP